MILGEFNEETGEPTIVGFVYFPRFKESGKVPFLLDTGAKGTVLHPKDARELKVPLGKLRNPVTSRGIGGFAQTFRERALVYFVDISPGRPLLRVYEVEIGIAEPSNVNEAYPSLLGRDITDYWTIQYSPPDSAIGCTVRSADDTLDDW